MTAFKIFLVSKLAVADYPSDLGKLEAYPEI